MTKRLRALVTDGDERPALAITRALGKRGVSVVVGEHHARSLSSASRYAADALTYPSPYRNAAAFDRFIIELASERSLDVVLPVSDVTTHAVCRLQDQLGRHCAVAVPPLHAFEQVTNKLTLLDLAARAGIRVPRTCYASTSAEFADLAARITFPAVLKPIRSKSPIKDGWVTADVEFADGPAQFRRWVETRGDAAGPCLIQERVFGSGVGVFALFDKGEIVAEFAHRRIREKPPAGGVSVLCESIPLPPRLRRDIVRLLSPLGWHGVAMVEYKHETQTGEFVLMEVNGRFWGSLQLAVDAGVDFPFLACELAQGRRPSRPSPYRIGIRSRWRLGDLDHLLLRLLKADAALHLPPGSPSRAAAIAAFFGAGGGEDRDEINRLDDIVPCWREARRYVSALLLPARRSARGRSVPTAPAHSPQFR